MIKTGKFIRLTKFLESRDDLRICTIYCAYRIPAMPLLDYGDCFILRVHMLHELVDIGTF